MRLFSVPADFKEKTIDAYGELNSKYPHACVKEVYGQATVGVPFGSGRNSRDLPGIDLKALQKYAAYCTEKGIDFNYTFNASCMDNREFTERGINSINRFLHRLSDIGITNLTVTLPSLIALIQDSGLPFRIKASTICQVNSPSKAAFYKSRGIDRLVIDEDITRDFAKIRRICEIFGDGVEMIVNSICMHNCPYKMAHYNHESCFKFGVQDIRGFYTQSCTARRISDWINPMHLNWVRPEDLALYENAGIRGFKIQGRQAVHFGDPISAVEAYMRGSYSGNLYDLLNLFDARRLKDDYHPYIENAKLDGFLAAFLNNQNHCTENCSECGHCASFAEAAMGKRKSEEMLTTVRANEGENSPFQSYHNKSFITRNGYRMVRKIVSTLTRQA
jgi:collagenase-like PrtC family protease